MKIANQSNIACGDTARDVCRWSLRVMIESTERMKSKFSALILSSAYLFICLRLKASPKSSPSFERHHIIHSFRKNHFALWGAIICSKKKKHFCKKIIIKLNQLFIAAKCGINNKNYNNNKQHNNSHTVLSLFPRKMFCFLFIIISKN